MTELLTMFKVESTEGAAQQLYQECVHIARGRTEVGGTGGLGLAAPQAPRGWMRYHKDENSEQIRKRLSEPRRFTVEEVECYFEMQYRV